MFRLQPEQHPELISTIEKFISAMLPHKQGDITKIPIILERLTSYIHLEEFSVEHYLLINLINSINDISLQTEQQLSCTFKHIDTYLSEEKLLHIVKLDGIGIHHLAYLEGLPYDPRIPSHLLELSRLIYKRVKDLYNRCMELEIEPNNCLGYVPALQEEFIRAIGMEALKAQEALVNASLDLNKYTHTGWSEFLRYNNFRGSDGWQNFLGYLAASLDTRIYEASEPEITLSMNRLQDMIKKYVKNTEIWTYYGVPSLDRRFGIKRVGFTVTVGEPKSGKTTFSCNVAAKILVSGGKVALFSQENPNETLLFRHIIPAYIKERYGFFVSTKQIIGQEEITGKDAEEIEIRKKCIQMALLWIAESGNVTIIQTLNVETMERKLKQLHSHFPFDYLMLDLAFHIAGSDKSQLEALSSICVRLKTDLRVHINLLSHAAPDWRNVLVGNYSTVTKNCSQFQGDCDHMLLLCADGDQQANQEADIVIPFARDENDTTERHPIQFIFASSSYTALHTDEIITVDDAIAEIDEDNPLSDLDDDGDGFSLEL